MFKLDLEKAEEPELKLPQFVGSLKKQEDSRKKKSTSALLTMPKPWLCESQRTVENSSRYGNTRPPTASWEIWMQIRKQQLKLDMEQQTGSKSRKDYIILLPCLFNSYAEYIMQNAGLDEAQAGIKIARRNISNLRYAYDTTLMTESKE